MVDQVRVLEEYRACMQDRIQPKSFSTVDETKAYIDENHKHGTGDVLQVTMCRNNPDDDGEPEPWRVRYNLVASRDGGIWKEW